MASGVARLKLERSQARGLTGVGAVLSWRPKAEYSIDTLPKTRPSADVCRAGWFASPLDALDRSLCPPRVLLDERQARSRSSARFKEPAP